MKQERYEEGRFTDHAHGLGTVTKDMVHKRAGEIALINGRSKHNILDSDWQQAYRELTGQEGLNPTPTAAEELTEDKRWAPTVESELQRAPTVPAPDEQTFAEKLVEEGIEEAEHEQMTEATKESLKRDKL
jgi:hypothetical protein